MKRPSNAQAAILALLAEHGPMTNNQLSQNLDRNVNCVGHSTQDLAGFKYVDDSWARDDRNQSVRLYEINDVGREALAIPASPRSKSKRSSMPLDGRADIDRPIVPRQDGYGYAIGRESSIFRMADRIASESGPTA